MNISSAKSSSSERGQASNGDAAPDVERDDHATRDDVPLPLETVSRDPAKKKSERKQRRGKRVLFVLLALAIAGGLAYWFREPLVDKYLEFTEEPAAVEQPSEPQGVVALGRLEPNGELIEVAAPESVANARVKELRVDLDSVVEEGELLAVLDNETRLQAQQAVASAQVQQARQKLKQAEINTSTMQAEIEAQIRSAKAERNMIQAQVRRQRELLQSSAATEQSVEDLVAQLEAAEARVDELNARLQRYLPQGDHEPIDIAVAREELDLAERSLEEAAARTDQAYVRSPIAGTILDIHVHPGESINQTTLLEMGATDEMKARIEVYESEVRRVSKGQAVRLRSPALAEELTGSVEKISALVKKQTVVDADPAAHTDARVVEVVVDLDDSSSEIASKFVGLQVRATFAP